MLAEDFIACLHNSSGSSTAPENSSSTSPSTLYTPPALPDIIENQGEYHQDGEEQDMGGLRRLLAQKQQEIDQKDQIIAELTDKCRNSEENQTKIQSLEKKVACLESLLERLQNQYSLQSGFQDSEGTNNFKEVRIISSYIENNQSVNGNTLTQSYVFQKSKDNLGKPIEDNDSQDKGNRLLKEIKDSNTSDMKDIKECKDQRISTKITTELKTNVCNNGNNNQWNTNTNANNYKTIDKSDSYNQINKKFNQMKENLKDNKDKDKPPSTKNISQLYNLLSGNTNPVKNGQEDFVVKKINQKLQNILDSSPRTSKQPINVNTKVEEMYSSRIRPDTKIDLNYQPLHYSSVADRQKNDSFTYKSKLNSNYKPEQPYMIQTRQKSYTTARNKDQSLFETPRIPSSSFSKQLNNTKFNKILNSTTVNQMLQARKNYNHSAMDMPISTSMLNKSNDFMTERFQKKKVGRW